MNASRRIGIGLLSVLLGAGALAAEDIPLRNWTVPSGIFGGLGKQEDVSPPRPFIGLTPCRVIDTRGGAPLAGGILANSEARNFTVTGICGIPAGADAISANFTVTGSPAAPPGAFILAYPTGSPPSPIVSLLNFQAGQTIANAGIVALSAGSITINVSHSTHVIMDVNGYFSDFQGTPSNFFRLGGDVANPGAVIQGENSGSGVGVEGVSYGTAITSAGVRGTHTGSGIGVFGEALGTSGLEASAGVLGRSHATSSSAGVAGVAEAQTGRVYGAFGRTQSIGVGAAGVAGVDGTGFAAADFFPSAGVRGESSSAFGVLGVTESDTGDAAVAGVLATSLGVPVVQGSLGRDAGMNNYAVFAFGDYGGNGAKYFVEPHPRQADTVIRYVALEGPESGTYFRGRGKFKNGVATIDVPEDFRMVTDAEGLSVQITPIGGMASVGVLRIGLDVIVVQGSRNLEFFYMVNGVRRSHKHLKPVGPGQEYMPESPDATMPAYLTEVQKEMLISNGTYKADGTVNMETAKALGWERAWNKRRLSPP